MSETSGYIIMHSKKEVDSLASGINDTTTIQIDDDSYEISRSVTQEFVSLSIFTSEYSILENLKKYLFTKYMPDLLISSFDNKAYIKTLKGKKVVKSTEAYKQLAEISPLVDFYVSVSLKNKYKHALSLLEDKIISLNDSYLGLSIAERCLSSYSKELVVFAVNNGFHNYICKWRSNTSGDLEPGEHILHRLVNFFDIEIIRQALELGADPNGKDELGNSLLQRLDQFIFIEEKPDFSLELIDLLQGYGADFNKKDNEGNSIFFTLKESYNFEFEQLEDDEEDEDDEDEDYEVDDFEEKVFTLQNIEIILFNIIEKLLNCGLSVDSAKTDEVPLLENYKNTSKVYDLLLGKQGD